MNTKLPLSINQFDIYIDQIRWSDSSHLNIGAIATIIGTLDTQLFNDALNQLMRCHPGLRVRIDEFEGKPFQSIAEHQDEKLTLVNFSTYDNSEELAKQYIENDFQKSFRFGKSSPLAYFKIIRLSSKKYLWYGKFHHIISDGWGDFPCL